MSDLPAEPEEFDPDASSEVAARLPNVPASDSPTVPIDGGPPLVSLRETEFLPRAPDRPLPLRVEEFTPDSSSATLRAPPPSSGHRDSLVIHTITRPDGAQADALGVLGFRVRGELGRGAQGIVYRATPDGEEHDVAIKIARPEANPEQIERFVWAIEAMKSLHDVKGVVRLLSDGKTELGTPYYTMTLVRGPSLRAILNKGRLAPRQLVSLLAKVAYAVHQAHDRGIVHRDLKPENILLEDGPSGMKPYVADFGLARDLTGTAPGSSAGGLGGTPAYMAPEQALGKQITRRTDVHALGAILYEVLTGSPPFRGRHVAGVIHAIATQPPRRPQAQWTGLPLALEDVTLHALAKDPDERLPTAAVFAAQLRSALEGSEIDAVPTRRARLRQPGPLRRRLWRELRKRALFLEGVVVGLVLGGALGALVGLASV